MQLRLMVTGGKKVLWRRKETVLQRLVTDVNKHKSQH